MCSPLLILYLFAFNLGVASARPTGADSAARPYTTITPEALIKCGFTGGPEQELSQNIDEYCDEGYDPDKPAKSWPRFSALGLTYTVLEETDTQLPLRNALAPGSQNPFVPVFLGFHGTNSNNAAEYERNGVRRPRYTSGADAELGEGLYVSDDVILPTGFANTAAQVVNLKNKKKPGDPGYVTPKVCMIYAKDLALWIQTQKFFFPVLAPDNGAKLIKDSRLPDYKRIYEQNRINYALINAGFSGAFVRFGPLDLSKPNGVNQFSIPEALQDQLFAKCYNPGDPALLAEGTFPEFNYSLKVPPEVWDIKY